MDKYSKSPKAGSGTGGTPSGYSAPKGGQYVDRKLAGMSPDAAQEACKPTDADPVRLQSRLAGSC